jgi:polysaccharide biosynthesis protein PslE
MQFHAYERPLTLFDIIGSVFRFKWRVMCVSVLMLLLSISAVLLVPKKYESEAKLFVRLGRSAAIDPATIGPTISIQESRESEMNSIVDMLYSRGLAERVVDTVGVEKLLKNYSWIELRVEDAQKQLADWMEDAFPDNAENLGEGEFSSAQLKIEKRREEAIKKLQGRLKVDSPKKSTTITITYRAATPETARDVVQAIIDCYQRMHIEAYSSSGAVDFFDQQFLQQEKLLVRAEEVLREIKNQNEVVTMRGKQDSLQTEITSVDNMQLQTQAELYAARGRLAKLQADLDALPVQLVTGRTSGIAVGSTDAMRDRLYELEIKEKEYAAKYSDSHPELIKVRGQLSAARNIMEEQPTEREQTTLSVNPVHQQIQNEMLLAEATVASLESKALALETLERTLLQSLNDVNNLELTAESLQREIDVGREKYRNYARKLEESRISAALDQMSLSNVSIVAAPSLRFKHASPNRPLLAVLGIMFACCCGLATALASDYYVNSQEMQQVRAAERERYLKALALETARAEQAATELRRGMATDRSELDNISHNEPEVPVDLIINNPE